MQVSECSAAPGKPQAAPAPGFTAGLPLAPPHATKGAQAAGRPEVKQLAGLGGRDGQIITGRAAAGSCSCWGLLGPAWARTTRRTPRGAGAAARVAANALERERRAMAPG